MMINRCVRLNAVPAKIDSRAGHETPCICIYAGQIAAA